MSTNRVGRRNTVLVNQIGEKPQVNKLVVVKRSPTRAPSKAKLRDNGVSIGNPKTAKPIFIPKLALHSINRQTSDKITENSEA